MPQKLLFLVLSSKLLFLQWGQRKARSWLKVFFGMSRYDLAFFVDQTADLLQALGLSLREKEIFGQLQAWASPA